MTLGATSVATPTAPAAAPATVDFKLVTFNILAPCYKTEAASGELESANPENYLRRNRDICSLLLAQKADIICIQEFWAANEEVRACYVDTLNKEGYSHREVRRTSHWRTRKDGLACFVKDERIVLQDSRDIFFHDAGDRVAQLMLLAIQDPEPSPSSSSTAASNRHQQPKPKTPPQQFLVVNTHLLFPHNEFSSKIRMRETTKVLGFVESYRQREMCADVCGRSDVRVPVILTGDLNGSPRGRVYQYIRSQNYRSAMQEKWQAEGPEGQQKWAQWVSHRNHREQIASVDHVFFLNPTDQEEGRLPPVPDWTNLVFREVLERIRERQHYDTDAATGAGAGAGAGAGSGQGTSASASAGTGASQGKKGGSGGSGGGGLGLADETALRRAFDDFDEDHSQFVTRQEFEASLLVLGFGSEGEPALTPEEIDLLVETADKNGDGLIDFREFCDRFERALACDEDDDDCVPFSRSTWLVDDLSVGSRERRVAAEAVGRGRGGGGGGGGGGGDGDAEAAQQQQQQPSQGLLSADQDGAARGAGLGPSASERARQAVLERVLLQQAAGTGAQPSAADLSSLAVISKELPDARPMGNLSVRRASIWPPALERGEWPADWTLSDHGMVSVEFSGEVSSS